MENISMLLAFVIFPFFISGYITFESWRAPQKYHDQMKALYGEDSWYTQLMTSRYVVLIYRVIALIIFLVTFSLITFLAFVWLFK